jgi:hypothetical protein
MKRRPDWLNDFEVEGETAWGQTKKFGKRIKEDIIHGNIKDPELADDVDKGIDSWQRDRDQYFKGTTKTKTPRENKRSRKGNGYLKNSMRRNFRNKRRPTKRTFRRLRRKTRMKRRPPSRRTGTKSMVRLIKKVAISTMEARRHVFTQSNFAFLLNSIRTFPLARIVQVQGPTTEANNVGTFSGKEVYFKGIRMRAYIRNPTQYAVRLTLEIVSNKITTGAVNMADDTAVNAATIWHNPIDGKETSYTNIPNLFQLTATRQKNSLVNLHKKIVRVLHPSQRGEGATTATAEAFTSAADADLRDQTWIDFYLPINRKIKKRADQVTLGIASIFEKDYALWIRAEPLHEEVNFVSTAVAPLITFTAITYFRD